MFRRLKCLAFAPVAALAILTAVPGIASAGQAAIVGNYSGFPNITVTSTPGVYALSASDTGTSNAGDLELTFTEDDNQNTDTVQNGMCAITTPVGTFTCRYNGTFKTDAKTPNQLDFWAAGTITGGTGAYRGDTGSVAFTGKVIDGNTPTPKTIATLAAALQA